MTDDMYANASIETLYEWTENGDNEACACYIRRRAEENALTMRDLQLLDGAIRNLSRESAVIGSFVYGTKGSKYRNERKEFFCYAVLEQGGDEIAHKRLVKAYREHADCIDEVDGEVMQIAFGLWAARCVRGRMLQLCTQTSRMPKESRFPEYKSAYLTKAFLVEPSGRKTAGDDVYVGYLRGKNRDRAVAQMQEILTDTVSTVAGKCKISAGELRFEDNVFFRFAGDGQAPKHAEQDDRIRVLTDADVQIDVSDEGRLQRNVCAACGGALGADGVCVACGAASDDGADGIVIRRDRQTEALLCTQCGAPVQLEKGDKTAFCPACGTTFAVNGSSLAAGIYGINYENIKADMPEGAQLPDVKFVRAGVAGDTITAIMPANFEVMSDEMRRAKYPVNAPRYIYTTPDSLVNLTVNFLGALEEKDVFAFGRQMLSSLKGIFPTAKFGEAKQLTTPRNIFFVDFITAAIDQSIYNAMFFFSFEGRQGVGSWNCLGKDRWFWAPVFEHAVRTVGFAEK